MKLEVLNLTKSRALRDVMMPLWKRGAPGTNEPVTYIIACTHRTGSYLLCDGLEESGVAGRPTELCGAYSHELCSYVADKPQSFAQIIETVVAYGRTDNGVFGTKLHWSHVEELATQWGGPNSPEQFLLKSFPSAQYIYLFRRDLIAQAISLHRAHQTNEWWPIAGKENPHKTAIVPQFNAWKILRLKHELSRQRLEWENFFATNSIRALPVAYEDLAADYHGQLGGVLEFLGQDKTLADSLSEPRFLKQGDALNMRWRQMFDDSLARGIADGPWQED